LPSKLDEPLTPRQNFGPEDSASYKLEQPVAVGYSWSEVDGCSDVKSCDGPVVIAPTFRAESTAPITFDLDGNRGLEVLSEGYLRSE